MSHLKCLGHRLLDLAGEEVRPYQLRRLDYLFRFLVDAVAVRFLRPRHVCRP